MVLFFPLFGKLPICYPSNCMSNSLKTVNVVAAAILRDGKLFAAQRPSTKELPLKWEFPGGKIETGESPVDALQRELFEELAITVSVQRLLTTVHYTYPTFRLCMSLYLCTLNGTDPVLKEHVASRWLTSRDLPTLDWAPADLQLLPLLSPLLAP